MTVRSLLFLLAALSWGAVSHAADLVPPGHTLADLRAQWQIGKPTHQGDPHTAAPAAAAPYAAGTLAPSFLDDGLRTLNFARFVAGVPADVTLAAAATDEAQHGAVLLAKLQDLTHTPGQPADMPDDFYQTGKAACASSNVASGNATLADAVRQWLADFGNLPSLAHRRWALYPPLQQTALGFCQGYAVMKVTGLPDRAAAAPVPAAIPWPAAGLFPVQWWDPGETWSVCLDPEQCPPSGQETVTVKRVSDGRTWTLNQGSADPQQGYLTVNTERYGWPYCLSFRIPAAEVRVTPGEAYEIAVQGVKAPDGKPLDLAWRTEFCSLGAALTGTKLTRSADAAQPPLSFSFTSDIPTTEFSWRLFWLFGDGTGRYYTLGAGTTGALAAGEHTVALPLSMALPAAQAGAAFELDYTVTDQYGAFPYHVSLPVQ